MEMPFQFEDTDTEEQSKKDQSKVILLSKVEVSEASRVAPLTKHKKFDSDTFYQSPNVSGGADEDHKNDSSNHM